MPESEAVRMGRNVQIGDLADVIMETLEDYADLAAEDVKPVSCTHLDVYKRQYPA